MQLSIQDSLFNLLRAYLLECFVYLVDSFIPLLSPLSLFSLFSLRFLRMMKSSKTPRVTKITGQPIENSFLTSSFFSRGDLIGGIVPTKRKSRNY